MCLCPYCPLWCAGISDFSVCVSVSAGWRGKRKRSPGCLSVPHIEARGFENVVCACHLASVHALCMFFFSPSFQILFTVSWINGFCLLPRNLCARLQSCSRQVTGSTRISRRHTEIKATTGPLKNHHSTTMKEVSACADPPRLVKSMPANLQ